MATSDRFPSVHLTADVVTLSLRPEGGLSVLLVRRGNPPFKGRWALPGGFVDEGEAVDVAARRELAEETGLDTGSLRLSELGAYTAPRRDPRHRTVSIAFWAAVAADLEPTAADDADDARWFPVADLLGSRKLAFDHEQILQDAVSEVRHALETTTVATRWLPDEFTIADLRAAYEAVWDRPLDAGNFQRKVLATEGFVSDTGWRTAGGRGRPATLFTAGPAEGIWPPMSQARER